MRYIVVLLALLFMPTAAHADECPAIALRPSVEVIVDMQPIEIKNSMSGAPDPAAFGTTHYKSEVRQSMSLAQASQRNSDMVCQYLNKVTLTWVMRPYILVNEDFKPGSCKYNAIVAMLRKSLTEQQITINSRLSYFQEPVLTYAAQALAMKPMSTGDAQAEQQKFSAGLEKPITESADRILADVNNRIAELRHASIKCP